MIFWLPRYFQDMRHLSESQAGTMSSAVMVLALIGAPVGGYITDSWRKTQIRARLLFPAISTLITAILLFTALYLLKGTVQYIFMLFFGVTVIAFIAGATSVTQDVIHPGLRATSYAIAVVVQNLFGASTASIIMGKIYDLTNIQTAFAILPFVLLLGSVLFYLGSRHYPEDLRKVAKVSLEAAG
jgi:sugar phosphate permease